MTGNTSYLRIIESLADGCSLEDTQMAIPESIR